MKKQAKIKTELQPHQQRVLQKLLKGNVLIAHGTGSGKTLASIAAADKIGNPTTVLTPASLTKNYEKELEKHKTGGPSVDVQSINKAVLRDTEVPEGNTLIVDEAHGLRNTGTKRQKYIKGIAPSAGRLALLTATPSYNRVSDIAPLINLVRGEKALPENTSEFDKRFVEDVAVNPGLWNKYVHGLKPGVTQKLKNERELFDLMSGRVDVHEMTEGYPATSTEDIYTEMSPSQREVYRYLEEQVPANIRRKIQQGLPPSKQEAKNLNNFLVGVRQASLSYAPYKQDVDPLQAAQDSPKMMRAVEEIKKRMKVNKNFRGMVYSNWIDAGLKPMAKLLEHNKIPYGMFHGGLNAKEKKELVRRYNEGEMPVLLGSSSAGEGLDLKGTRLMQILDPHFNEGKITQIIGRGNRYKSHEHLPEDERRVDVQRFYSRPNAPGILQRLGLSDPERGAEEWLYRGAKEKQDLIDKLKQVMLRASKEK